MGMAAGAVFMLVGDLNLGKVIAYQADGAWLVFKQPSLLSIFWFQPLPKPTDCPTANRKPNWFQDTTPSAAR